MSEIAPLKDRMKQFNLNTVLSGLILTGILWVYRSVEMTKIEVATVVARFQANENAMLEVKVKLAQLETQVVQARIDVARIESKNGTVRE